MSNKPDFIFIGPGRSGTTFVYHYLNEHPNVYLAKDVKEINYFTDYFEKRGESWYQSFFSESGSEQISGEISNMYFYDLSVPKKIKSTVPDAKLITILRNPYERVISAYQYRLSVGEIADISFDDALLKFPDLIEQNRYYSLLSEYYRYFEPDQIHVLFYEDLKQDSYKFLDQINKILGIEEMDYSFGENSKNSRKGPRFKKLTKVIRKVSDVLKEYQLYKIHSFFKNNALIRKIVFRKVNQATVVSDSSKKILQSNLQGEIDKLSELLNRDLSSWQI